MIVKRAIEEFLRQQVDDFSWMKSLPKEEIEWAIKGLDPVPQFDYEPLDLHQMVSFLLGLSYPGFYIQLDMGLGKTRVALELIKYRMRLGEIRKALVFVPMDTVAKSWRAEIHKWMPQINHHILIDMDTVEKRRVVEEGGDGIYVVTYQAFNWMMSELEKKSERSRKKHLVLQGRHLRLIQKQFQSMTLDEATRIGSRDSTVHVALRNCAKMIVFRTLLAGRPFGKDPEVTWSQYYIVDRGASLGETLGLFREAFYIAKNKFNPNGKGFWHSRMRFAKDYKINEKREELLGRFLGNRSIYYHRDEAIDLPPEIPLQRICEMPDQQKNYWDGILKRIKASYAKAARGEGTIERENTFLRMRQLAAGFLGLKDEDGGKIEIVFRDNPKLDDLVEALLEMPDGAQALICTEYNQTGRLIHERLKQEKIEHGWVYGGTTSKEYDIIKKRYDTEPGYHIIGGWKKMGIGINAQAASYLMMYETPTNPLEREQFIARARRKGVKHEKMFVVDFIMNETKDWSILDAIKDGDDLYTRIMRSPKLLIEEDLRRAA